MPSGYRKDRVSGSVSEPRTTFSRQPAIQRYNPALVSNSSLNRNGLILPRPSSKTSAYLSSRASVLLARETIPMLFQSSLICLIQSLPIRLGP